MEPDPSPAAPVAPSSGFHWSAIVKILVGVVAVVIGLSNLYQTFFGKGVKEQMEAAIRDGMKSKLQVELVSLEISERDPKNYEGKATAANGDDYEVSSVVKGSQFEWKAVPGKAMMERILREGMEQKFSSKVSAAELVRKGTGSFVGTAKLENGETFDVETRLEGNGVFWEARRSQVGIGEKGK